MGGPHSLNMPSHATDTLIGKRGGAFKVFAFSLIANLNLLQVPQDCDVYRGIYCAFRSYRIIALSFTNMTK